MKINKILVPIDFSANSRNALRYAIDFALKAEASLHLLHSYYLPVPSIEVPVAVDLQQDDQEQMILDSWVELNRQVPELSRVNYSHDTEMGFLTDVINRKLEEHQFDLIIMGTKGCTNRIDQMLGSNAYNIAKEATVPVLIVPEHQSFEGFNQIALSADFHQLNLPSLDFVKSLAQEFESDIHLLHVSTEPQNLEIEEAQEALNLNHYFKGMKHHFEFMTQKEIVEGIEKYSINNEIDLTVLVPRHHGILERLFKKQVTRKVVLNAHVPLLILHDQ